MSHVKNLLPSLTFSLRKGACGKIAVIGGSEEYTGAPVFAALSVTRLGADLIHIFCDIPAKPIIKSFSPDFIVHSYFEIPEKLERIDALVMGPGLGRDYYINPHYISESTNNISNKDDNDILNRPKIPKSYLVKKVFDYAREKSKPLVLDGDALWFVSQDPSAYYNAPSVILTPNIVEFSRLYSATGNTKVDFSNKSFAEVNSACGVLSEQMGITIFVKGKVDLIMNPDSTSGSWEHVGSPRRCGGQGDTTAGTMALFYYWALKKESCNSKAKIQAGAACSQMIKLAANAAFKSEGRSMTTSDILNQFPKILKEIDNLE